MADDCKAYLPQDVVGGTGAGASQAAGGSGAVVEQAQQLRQLRGRSRAVGTQRAPRPAAAAVQQLVLGGREDRRGRRRRGRHAPAQSAVRPCCVRRHVEDGPLAGSRSGCDVHMAERAGSVVVEAD